MKRLENAFPISFTLGDKPVTINSADVLGISDDPIEDIKLVAHNYGVVSSYTAALKGAREQDKNDMEGRRAQLYHQLKNGGYTKIYGIAKTTEDAIEHAINDDEQVRALKEIITRQGVVLDQLYDLKRGLEMKQEILREIIQTLRQERKIDAKSPT